MSRPRILLAVTSAVSVPLLRGQARFLRQAGFDVYVVSARGPELEQAAQEGATSLAVPMKREISPLSDLVSLLRLCGVMWRVRPVLTNVGTPKAGLLAGLAARLTGVPCRIYTLRGLRAESAIGLKRKLLMFIERLACRCAQQVLCVSPSLRERAVGLGLVDREKTLVPGAGSSNGIDATHFAPTPERLARAAELRRSLGVPENALVIGFAGRLTRDKGVPELLQAFNSLRAGQPDLYLLLLGSLEEGDPLSPSAREALRGPNLLLAGEVADPADHLHAMDVVVLPTHREGFPNLVLEAHAAGKPVVTTRATGAVDSVLDGVNGLLVPVGEVHALAEAIARLLRDPSLRLRLGQAGRERVLRDFRPETIWQAQLETYLRLLTQNGQPLPQPAPDQATAGAR